MVQSNVGIRTVNNLKDSRFRYQLNQYEAESEESLVGLGIAPPNKETWFKMKKEPTLWPLSDSSAYF